jgi:2-polyprenyl-3-methyl-5-hydroxy-6-metoxy-1,4-benzoquinol methylase
MPDVLDRSCFTYLTSCPVCDSENSTKIADVKTIHPESPEQVMYCGCRVCQHRYHNPLPTQPYLSKLYSQGSRFVVGHTSGSSPDSPGVLSRVADNIFCGRKLQGLSVLEIGSGNGGFLRWIEQQGAHVVGVEPGPWGDGTPHTVHDISEIEPQSFDVIIMLDVLEHVSNPIGALNDLLRFASKDTVLVCAFPNSESVQSRLWKGRWRMVRPLGHLHYFSKASIDKLFERAGWTLLEKRPTWFRFSCRRQELMASYYALRGMHIRSAVGPFREALLGRDQWFVKATPYR